MNLGRGKIGACVVMVSLAAALIGGWAMSTDVTNNTITVYESVADISGYFDSSNEPIYIQYNPVVNYTGYYTSTSDPYFGGVSYTESQRPNNAPINQPITTISTGTKGIASTDSISAKILYYTPAIVSGQVATVYERTGTIHLISDVLSYWSMTTTANVFKLTSIDANLTPTNGYINADVTFFMVSSWNYWLTTSQPTHSPSFNMASQEYLSTYSGSVALYRPCLSAIIDLDKNTAELYFDNNCTDLCGIYSLTSTYIFKDPNTAPSSGQICSSPSFTYTSYNRPDPIYMDVSRGVRMES